MATSYLCLALFRLILVSPAALVCKLSQDYRMGATRDVSVSILQQTPSAKALSQDDATPFRQVQSPPYAPSLDSCKTPSSPPTPLSLLPRCTRRSEGISYLTLDPLRPKTFARGLIGVIESPPPPTACISNPNFTSPTRASTP